MRDAISLIIAGQRDRNMPVSCQREMASRIHKARLEVLPNCGHLTQLEGYRESNRLIDEFLGVVLPPHGC